MSRAEKIFEKLIRGRSDANMDFDDLCHLLRDLGFSERHGSGSHHIFFREGIDEIINIQTKHGKAKPYQVKQVRNIILKYRLGAENE